MANNLDEKVDQLESAIDPNTVISIGGYSFTPAKLMIAGGIVSSVLGGLYGAFEVYKDYQDMKAQIQEYVAPDLSEINKKMAVLEQNTASAVEFTRDINNNLKADIRRIEGVVDSVERGSKQIQREVAQDTKEVRNELRDIQRDVDSKIKQAQGDTDEKIREALDSVKQAQRDTDEKIRKALDNPLAE
jgi:BMFP domain-containing protein YqiC